MANFSTAVDVEEGEIISAPVRQYGDGNVLGTLARGVNFFQEQREASQQRSRQRASDARENERHEAWRREQTEKDIQRQMGSVATRWLAGAEQSVEQNGNILMPEPATPTSANPSTGASLTAALNNGISNTRNFARNILDGAREDPAVDNEVLDSIVRSVEAAAPDIQSQQAAAEQGRMPSIAATAAVDTLVRQLINRYPGYEYLIGTVMKDLGLDNQMFDDMRDAYEQQETVRDARSATLAEALQTGMQLAGPEGAAMPEDRLISTGLAEMRRQREATANKERLELLQIDASINREARETRDDVRQETERVVQQEIAQAAIAQMVPSLEAYTALVTAGGPPGSDPLYEGKLEEARLAVIANLNRAVGEVRARLLTTTDTATADATAASLRAYIDDTFVRPLTERDGSTGRLVTQMETTLGLQMRHAFPLVSMMREIGIDPSAIGPIVQAIGADGELRGRLAREIQGLDAFDLATPLARVQLTEIVGIMTGNTRLRAQNHTPQSARQIFNVVNRSTQQLASVVASGPQGNSSIDPFLNGMGEMVVAAGQLNPQSGGSALRNAGVSLLADSNGGRVIDAFNRANTVDPEKTSITRMGWRGSVANVLGAIRGNASTVRASPSTNYHTFGWDERSGRFRAVFDEAAWRAGERRIDSNNYAATPGLGSGEFPQPVQAPSVRPSGPPAAFAADVALANNLLNALVQTADWDADTPQATPLELRELYGRNRPTASMRREMGATNSRRRVNPRSDRMQAADQFIADQQNNPLRLTIPDTEREINEETGGEEDVNFSGVPADMAGFRRTVGGGESGNDPNVRNPEANMTARGLYGFTRGTFVSNYASAYGVTRGQAEAAWNSGAWRRPAVQNRLLDHIVQSYDRTFQREGLPVNNGTRYLAHFLGTGTAVAMLKANPNESIATVINRSVRDPDLRAAILNSPTNRAVFRRAGGTAGGLAREFNNRARRHR